DFVVAWQIYDQTSSTSKWDIYAQRYAADGNPEGSAFLVNSGFTVGEQAGPVVAMDATGDFVVAWQSYDQAGATSDYDIYAQRYAADGNPEGSAFLVNSQFAIGQQRYPAVAMDAAGDFVVAWQSYDQTSSTSKWDIYAQRYAADGKPEGSAFLVSSGVKTADPVSPTVAMDAVGDFMIAWLNSAENPSTLGAQFYRADGLPVGSNETLSSTNTNIYGQVVSMDAAGDAVMGYSMFNTHTTHFNYGISAQRFTPEQASPTILEAVGVSSESTVEPGSPFSVSFEVVNRTVPSFETTDAYLNSFIGAVSDPTIAVTLPAQAMILPAGGANWSCTGNRTASLTCTYAGYVGAGQYSPPLLVGLVAPETPGTLVYGASVTGSSEPAFTGSVTVANAPSGSGGGGGFGWIELVGLALVGFLRRFEEKSAA
ncbi:MAG: hypothetical protein ACYCVU_04225, partial [Gammaproteobacteria bacterium]